MKIKLKKFLKIKRIVILEYYGSVFPWIIASEFVVQNRCSTGIEAFLIGKNVSHLIQFIKNIL